MDPETKPQRFALLRRIAASRITTVVAVVAALALLTTGTLLAFSKFFPPVTDYGYDRAPSAFPTTITPLGSPALTRGQTMPIGLQSISDAGIDSIELWEGGALYLRITEVETATVNGTVVADLTLDYAPLLAGVHIVMARVTNDKGQVSQSDPLTVAVLDNAIDTGSVSSFAVGDPAASSTVAIHTVAGDTIASVAARLGTSTDLVSIPDAGIRGSLGASRAAEGDFAAGSLAFAPLITQATAHTVENFGYAPVEIPRITAGVTDCVVTVTATSESLSVYASTPMHAGFARIGDVSPGTPFASNALPIGPSTIIAYKSGTASSDVSGANAPTEPVTVLVPEDCASAGWTGDAKVVNGILLTDEPVTQPYAYVSVDGATWKRVPEQQGQFLTTGNLNDVRSSLAVDRYDQLDVQVWSYADGQATQAAAGSFCRATMPNPDPSHSSGTGTKCQPPGQIPGQTTDAAANGFSLSAAPGFSFGSGATVSQSVFIPSSTDAVSLGLNSDTNVTTTIDLTKQVAVQLSVQAYKPEFDRVIFQFSYYPISPATTTLRPPGVFYSQEMSLSTLPKELNEPGLPKREAKLTIDPWQWRNAKIGDLTSDDFATDGGTLALEDEIAANLALDNLQNDKNVIDTVYVRAVAADSQYYAKSIPGGFATQSVKITMTDPTVYGTLPNPTAAIVPGIDTTAPDTATRNKCFTVQSLPEPNTWVANPFFGPEYAYIFGKKTQTEPGNEYYSDRAMADRYWDIGNTYCLDPAADAKRAQAAADAADDCSWFCVFTSILIGATVGFLTGGPAGALMGAMAGASVALGAGSIIAEYYALLKALWDEIAKAYNTIYDTVNTLLAQFNPICLQAGLISKDAKAACVTIAKSVQSAVITSVTGLPPQLPTSEVLEKIGEGKLQAAIEAGLDLALGQIGLSCETFEIDSDGETALTALSDKAGNADTDSVLNAARTEDGKLSGCHALAGLVTSTVRKQLTDFYGNQVSSIMEVSYVPGTVIVPVSDTSPTIAVTASPATSGPFMTGCPVTANIVAVMPYLWSGDSKLVQTEFSFKPITSTLKPKFTGPGFTFQYYAEIPVPLIPSLDRRINPEILTAGGQKPATAAAPYFTATIDSPCFDSTLLIKGYRDGSGSPAYVPDPRPVTYYY